MQTALQKRMNALERAKNIQLQIEAHRAQINRLQYAKKLCDAEARGLHDESQEDWYEYASRCAVLKPAWKNKDRILALGRVCASLNAMRRHVHENEGHLKVLHEAIERQLANKRRLEELLDAEAAQTYEKVNP